MSFSVTIDNCLPCCSSVGTVLLSCRNRGGSAILCGYTEYAGHESSPPKAYRTKTMSGSRSQKNYNGPPPCLSLNQTITESYAGTCSYNANTCNFTDNSTWTQTAVPGGVVVQHRCSVTKFTWESFVDTATSRTVPLVGGCQNFNGSLSVETSSCTIAENLTDEDTENDAIARLLAGAGGTWSNFVLVGDGTGGTCVPPSCCRATYEQRTVNTNFAYRESQFQANISNLLASNNYTFTIDVMRRPYNTGNYALAFQSVYGFTANGTGEYSFQDDVPYQVGWDTYVTNPVVNHV